MTEGARAGTRSPAQLASAACGAGLFASAFLWRDVRAAFYTACIVGACITVLSVAAWARRAELRWANAALAMGLFFWTLLLPTNQDGAIVLTNFLVSMLVLIFSFFPLQARGEPLTSWTVPPNPDF
jgi:hypothetical protein